MSDNYVDTSKVFIRRISKSVAKEMIIEYHYTHSWTTCRYALGIYYKDNDLDFFGNNKLIGVIVYGSPVGVRASKSISPLLNSDEILELKRLYIHDGYGKNIESYCISQSFDWLRDNAPDIKALLSYADSQEQHLGTIYQATNWLYQGIIEGGSRYISFQKDPYKWMHPKSFSERWGSRELETLKETIGNLGYDEFYVKKASGKHRYVYILETNKGLKKRILGSLKHDIKPYPKENIEEFEIKTHETIKCNKMSKGYW